MIWIKSSRRAGWNGVGRRLLGISCYFGKRSQFRRTIGNGDTQLLYAQPRAVRAGDNCALCCEYHVTDRVRLTVSYAVSGAAIHPSRISAAVALRSAPMRRSAPSNISSGLRDSLASPSDCAAAAVAAATRRPRPAIRPCLGVSVRRRVLSIQHMPQALVGCTDPGTRSAGDQGPTRRAADGITWPDRLRAKSPAGNTRPLRSGVRGGRERHA